MPFALTNRTPLMHSLCALLLLCAAGTLHAETDGHILLKFQREAEALNAPQEDLGAQQPDVNRYRAGFFYGYINGVLDSLNRAYPVCAQDHAATGFSDSLPRSAKIIHKHLLQNGLDITYE